MSRSSVPDEVWMSRALDLARRGEGLTRPNPPVGAVVVLDGKCVGVGFHARAGESHAEALALKAAGSRARGATLYVTLEPCSTWGRTPPCVEAIVAAGVKRVVVGSTDPNPRNRGRGYMYLRKHGITVKKGLCAEAATRLIAPFAKWIATGTPYVTLKLAMTADGRIADRSGRSRWISGRSSRNLVRDLRRTADAILVGWRTVAADDPRLLRYGLPSEARGHPHGQPMRVVLDSRGSSPASARVFSDGNAGRTIVATTSRCPAARRSAYGRRGAEVVVFPSSHGRVRVDAVLGELGRRGVLHVLCEGGGGIAAALLDANAVDRYVFFMAPSFLGGGGVPAVAGRGWLLGRSPRLEFGTVSRMGADIMIEARPMRSPAGRRATEI